MAFLLSPDYLVAVTADTVEQLALDCTALIAFVTASLSIGNCRQEQQVAEFEGRKLA